MAFIIADRLTKTFPGETRPAVDQVSFEIKQGEFVVLLGTVRLRQDDAAQK
jgi:osmoprotectant transport system ATP-binding protein